MWLPRWNPWADLMPGLVRKKKPEELTLCIAELVSVSTQETLARERALFRFVSHLPELLEFLASDDWIGISFKVWPADDVRTGEELLQLRGHETDANGARFSSDGELGESVRSGFGWENADFGHSLHEALFDRDKDRLASSAPAGLRGSRGLGVEMCQPGSRPCFFKERVAGAVLRKVTSAFAAPSTLVPL